MPRSIEKFWNIIGFILIVFCLLIPNLLFSQTSDSLLFLQDLSYSSELEKKLFYRNNEQLKGKEFLPFFLNFQTEQKEASLNSIIKIIDQDLTDLRSSKFYNNSEEKIIKIIHGKIYADLLKKYKLEADFHEIFVDGTFNCVTATVLYSCILEELNVPFAIKEMPTHVYLIGFPRTSKIKVETTSPIQNYFAFDNEFQLSYLNSLLANKIITEEELKISDKSKLFNTYFFTDKDISFRELAGIHYSNDGIYDMNKKDYINALINFKKAYILYPCARNKFLLQNIAAINCSNNQYKSKQDVDNYILLARLSSYNSGQVTRDVLIGEFANITDKQLITSSNVTLYNDTYQQIRAQVKDSLFLNEISYTYHYNMGWVLLSKGNAKECLPNLIQAYQIHPNNANLQQSISEYLRITIGNFSDPMQVLKMIDDASKNFTFLNTHINVLTTKSNCYLILAQRNFNSGSIGKGEENLMKFEKAVNDFTEITINENFVEASYQAAGGAYFRRGEYAKAKEKFRKGLKYAPSNLQLQSSLSKIKNY